MAAPRDALILGLGVGGVVGLIMAMSVWAGFEGGATLLPIWIAMPLNLPAYIGAAVISRNIHAPSSALFATLALLQWVAVGGAAGGAIGRSSGSKPNA